MRLFAIALLATGCATVLPAIVGQRFAPELPALDGQPFEWPSTRGKVVLVDIWASWCRQCAAELPAMASLQKELGDDFRYVGVDVDADPRAGRAFMNAVGAGTLLTLSDRNAAYVERHLEVRQAPTRLFLDRAGTVRFVQEGFAAGDESRVRDAVRVLLGEPIPTTTLRPVPSSSR